MAKTKAKKKTGSASKRPAAKPAKKTRSPAGATGKKPAAAARSKSAARPAAAKPKLKAKPKPAKKPVARPVKAAKSAKSPTKLVKAPAPAKPKAATATKNAKPATRPVGRRAVAVSHRPQAAVTSVQARPAPVTANGRSRGRVSDDLPAGIKLTEDQIRRAPESAYMNDSQLAFFQERLLQMRSEVLARELDVKERLHQREVFADPADRASAEEEHWLDLRLRERESLLLKKIDDALKRIRDREYGYCEKTGEQIGIARLLARPTATVCVDIKGQDERAESQYRDR